MVMDQELKLVPQRELPQGTSQPELLSACSLCPSMDLEGDNTPSETPEVCDDAQ